MYDMPKLHKLAGVLTQGIPDQEGKDTLLDLMEKQTQRQFKERDTTNNYIFICLSSANICLLDYEMINNQFKPKHLLLCRKLLKYSILNIKYLPALNSQYKYGLIF